MGTGRLDDGLLLQAVEATTARGDIAEVGVYRGHLFHRLIKLAHVWGTTAHAFDSFEGMGDPGEYDQGMYRRGQLSSGGIAAFRKAMGSGDYELHQGYIPDCFAGSEHLRFAFAYLDVDHYEPTRVALPWLWERLLPGGVLGMDDTFPGRGILAGKAIDEWLDVEQPEVIAFSNNQMFVRKP